jgi:hypothetical protein
MIADQWLQAKTDDASPTKVGKVDPRICWAEGREPKKKKKRKNRQDQSSDGPQTMQDTIMPPRMETGAVRIG